MISIKKFFDTNRRASILLAVFFILTPLTLVHAQVSSIADVCGQTSSITTACKITDIKGIVKGVMKLVITLGLPLLVVFVTYRFVIAWFALQQGNVGAYKDALKKSGNAILGFFFVVTLFAGLFAVLLKYFGVKDQPLKLLELFSDAFVTHAYAQSTGEMLPNFLKANNLYELILSILRLIMRFFVYPALIVIWVWTGFSFVWAQGAPDALNKSKKWLMWAVITTLIIFLLQSFLIAAQGTVEKILPGSTAAPATTNPGSPAYIPAPGTYGASCPNGGQVMTNGQCSGARSSSYTYGSDCTGKSAGTLCDAPVAGGIKTGTCSSNEQGVFSCYTAMLGDMCITGNGIYGAIDASLNCIGSMRPLVPRGGSCRISAECGGGYSCISNGNGGTCK